MESDEWNFQWFRSSVFGGNISRRPRMMLEIDLRWLQTSSSFSRLDRRERSLLDPRCEEAIVFQSDLRASVTSYDSTVVTREIRSMHTAVCELVVQWEHRVSYAMNDQKAGKAREDNGSISHRR